MSKQADVDALLGTPAAKKAAPAKKAAAKPAAPVAAKTAKVAPVAAKTAKVAPVAAKKAAPAEKRVKVPVVFEEGEREALIKRIKAVVKKPINIKDLAVKLEVSTRKLRRVCYSAAKQNVIHLQLEGSKAAGQTVSPV